MSTKQDMELQLEAMISLVRHPGWKLLEAAAAKQADEAMARMRNSKSNDELVRASITYMAIKDVMSAPDTIMKVLTQNLDVLNKKAK